MSGRLLLRKRPGVEKLLENAVASGIQGVFVPDEKRLARTLLVEVWEALTRYFDHGRVDSAPGSI